MIKALKKSSIVFTPFHGSKDHQLSNVANEDIVLTEAGEGVTMEFADYGNGSGFPVINTDCLIALEQQEGDKLTVREGQKRTGIFYPDTEPTNQDGTFKRVVYSQIKSTFYNKSTDPTKTFGLEHIDIPSSRTQKFLLNSLYLMDVPTRIMGEKIQPGTVRMVDENSDDAAIISDDGHNNLYASRDIFWKKQEVGDFNNEFTTGSINNCSAYFDFSVPDAPVSLSVSSGSAVLNWQFTSSSPNRQLAGFAVERSFIDETNYSILNYVPSSSVGGYVDDNPPQGLVFYRVYAFNTFGNSAYLSGSINFGSPITEPPIPDAEECDACMRQFLSGSVTADYESPTRGPGFFADTQSFFINSGSTFTVWMRSSQFDAWLNVFDPTGSLVAESDVEGWTPPGDIDDAYVAVVAEQTGDYTFEATTFNPGESGEYQLVVTTGSFATIPVFGNAVLSLIYVSSSGYIFTGDELGPTMSIVNTATNAVVNTLTNPNFIDFSGSIFHDLTFDWEYSPIQQTVYALCGGNTSTDLYLLTTDAFGTSLGENAISSSVQTGGDIGRLAYDSKNDRLLIIGTSPIDRPNWEIIDCSTAASLASGSISGFADFAWWPAYCSSSHIFYITLDNAPIMKIDADTFAVTTSSLQGKSSPIVYIKEVDRLFTFVSGELSVINPADDTVEAVLSNTALGEFSSFQGLTYDHCRNEIVVSEFNFGLACFDATTYLPKAFSAPGSNKCVEVAFSTTASSVYVIHQDGPSIIKVI